MFSCVSSLCCESVQENDTTPLTPVQPNTTNEDSLIMNQDPREWTETFRALFDEKVAAYRKGTRTVGHLFSEEETRFLRTIGSTPQEIFDFVEDWCDAGEPDPETALAITRIRWDYLQKEQGGTHSERVVHLDSFPSRQATLAGLEWFPRIIEKAKAKLRGELPPDLMYACGGDRRFLKKVNVDPVEFLQVTRDAGEKVEPIIQFVTNRIQST